MFVASHLDGPLASPEGNVSIAAPRVPERLYYAPTPAQMPGVVCGYILVGYNEPPERPWPGQIEYALNREASTLVPHAILDYAESGMEQGCAVYELVEP